VKEQNIDLEKLLRESLKEAGEKIPLPPADEVWREISQELKKRSLKRRRSIRRKFIAAAAILAVSAGSFLLIFSPKVNAIGEKVVQIITQVTGNTVTVNTNTRENPKTDTERPTPPPAEDALPPAITPKTVSLEEARKLSPFPFRNPKYLPDGFKLLKVSIVKSEVTAVVTLEYGQKSSELLISEQNIIGEMASSDNVRAGEAEIREIDVAGNRGTMFMFPNGLVALQFLADGIRYDLRGYVKPEAMLTVAKSLIE